MGSTPPAAVIVLAGGIGARMQAGTNKVYLTVNDKELLAYSLATIDGSDAVDLVVVVAREDDRAHAEELVGSTVTNHPWRMAIGGDSRHASERSGIDAVRADIERGEIGVVAVHDGARPFMSRDLLERVLAEAASTGGAIAGAPIADALYRRDDATLLDPDDFVRVQTPQAFAGPTVLGAHDAAKTSGFEGVDTAEVVERFTDQAVAVVAGEATNIKVTLGPDLETAASYAERWSAEGQLAPTPEVAPVASLVPVEPAALGLGAETSGEVAAFAVATAGARATPRIAASELRAALAAVPPSVTAVVFVDEQSTSEVVPEMVASFAASGVMALLDHHPSTDAIKRVDGGVVVSSVDRANIGFIRVPEVVDRAALDAALEGVDPEELVDPTALVAAGGGAIGLFSAR